MRATLTDSQYSTFVDATTGLFAPDDIRVLFQTLDIVVLNQFDSLQSLSDFQVKWLAFACLNGLLGKSFNLEQLMPDFESYINKNDTRSSNFVQFYNPEMEKLKRSQIIIPLNEADKNIFVFNNQIMAPAPLPAPVAIIPQVIQAIPIATAAKKTPQACA